MTTEQQRNTQIALTYLTEKKTTEVKGRMVYNKEPTRPFYDDKNTSSPTATLEGIFLTTIIDTYKNQDVMSTDIPNAFIQAPISENRKERPIFMKTIDPLVGILVNIHPKQYHNHVVYEKGNQ